VKGALNYGKAHGCGFSLIELLVAVAIVAIIAAVALPSYKQYVYKSSRSSAEAILMESAQYMERYYTANNSSYAGATLPATTAPKGASGSAVKYNLTFVEGDAGVATTTALSASAFTVQAVPAGDQANDSCGTLTLSSTGAQTPTTSGCW
jgi:type IV pilus assembly protein PilE